MSDNCGEDKPPTARQCKERCLDSLEETSGSDKWASVVDGQFVSVYIDEEGSERTISANLTHLAEFLETPNRCSNFHGFTYILLVQILQGKIS